MKQKHYTIRHGFFKPYAGGQGVPTPNQRETHEGL